MYLFLSLLLLAIHANCQLLPKPKLPCYCRDCHDIWYSTYNLTYDMYNRQQFNNNFIEKFESIEVKVDRVQQTLALELPKTISTLSIINGKVDKIQTTLGSFDSPLHSAVSNSMASEVSEILDFVKINLKDSNGRSLTYIVESIHKILIDKYLDLLEGHASLSNIFNSVKTGLFDSNNVPLLTKIDFSSFNETTKTILEHLDAIGNAVGVARVIKNVTSRVDVLDRKFKEFSDNKTISEKIDNKSSTYTFATFVISCIHFILFVLIILIKVCKGYCMY